MVAYSKNKETKNWVSDYSKQKTGNVLGANLISVTKYSSKKCHLITERVKTYLFRWAFSSLSDLNLLSVCPILNFMFKNSFPQIFFDE